MEKILVALLDIYVADMMRIEKKDHAVVKAELAERVVKEFERKYPDFMTPLELETVRYLFLQHQFDANL